MAINPRNRAAERATQERLQDRIAARYERAIRREIAGTMRDVAAAYERRGDLVISQAIADHSGGLEQALRSGYQQAAMTFGERLLSSAKCLHGERWAKKDADAELEERVRQFIQRWTATKIVQINSTTERQIRALIRRGLEQGDTLPDIARTIRNRSAGIGALRAHVIARTEVHTAAAYGNQEGAELTGLELEREWMAASDERTREDHALADGQRVGMNDPFDVGGELLAFPGDPEGAAEQIIMCRCSAGYWAR